MKNLVGTIIDHYQVLRKIRETPTRILYRVYNFRVQTYVALEIVKFPMAEPTELLSLITDQIAKIATLTHPSIANNIDIGIFEDKIYMVYDFKPVHILQRDFNTKYSWRETAQQL